MSVNVIEIVFDVLAFLFAVSVHEAAHAWTADRLGDSTARHLGRVTLNPLRHIDPIGTIVMPLVGILSGLPVLGWARPTPVNVARLRQPRRDDLLVSAAGPASNFAVAVTALTALLALRFVSAEGAAVVGFLANYGHPEEFQASASFITPLALLLYRFLFINVLLAVFNLIPIPPLDGSHILGNLLPVRLQVLYAEIGRFGFLILIGLLWLGVPYRLFSPVLAMFTTLLRM